MIWTGSQTLDLLSHIKDDIQRSFSCDISFKKKMSICTSTIDETDQGDLIIEIGSKELFDNPKTLIPTENAMIPIIALFHEVCGHGMQMKQEFNQDRPLSAILALNHYACHASLEYYSGTKLINGRATYVYDERYYRQPHEIAAQYAAIRAARSYLSQTIGSKEANDMICAYVNMRLDLKCEFLKSSKRYTSVNSILEDFDDYFQDSITKHRKFKSMFSVYSDDMVGQYLRQTGDKALITWTEITPNGLKQDQLMTAMYMYVKDPVMRLRSQKALRDINLNPETVSRLPIISPLSRSERKAVTLTDLIELELGESFVEAIESLVEYQNQQSDL